MTVQATDRELSSDDLLFLVPTLSYRTGSFCFKIYLAKVVVSN